MKILICILFTFSISASADYLFVEGKFSPNKKWMSFSQDEEMNIKNLLKKLAKSKTGKTLIIKANSKANNYGKTIYDIIAPGRGSLTDTTLIRKFSAGNPEHIVYETESKVYINKELNQYDALLDLAHELTHFVYRDEFNPYKSKFSLADFIKNTIEGKGGEVRAFMTECRVLLEIFPSQARNRFNCHKVINPDSTLSRTKAVAGFYQVGSYYDSFVKALGKHGIKDKFPGLTSTKVSFVSSAYGIPYPVAAYEEYLTVLSKVCENDKRRLGYFKQKKSRSPASVVTKMESSYKSRCSELFE